VGDAWPGEDAPGVQSADVRPSEALNLAALMPAPILAASEVLQEAGLEDFPADPLVRRSASTAAARHKGRRSLPGHRAQRCLELIASGQPVHIYALPVLGWS
jgi:Domain of unknown function (DUF151)